MSPIKYFGKISKTFGKPLWEIVLNLKNFGIGRLVQRTSTFTEYPNEPSYYKILQVEPHSIEYHPGKMIGNIWVETVFRGNKINEPENLKRIAAFDDFQLVSKLDEESLVNKPGVYTDTNIWPRTVQFPPLWKELIIRDMKRKGQPIKVEDLHLNMIYSNEEIQAEEGQVPNVDVTCEHTSPLHPDLYEGVIFDRKEAVAHFSKIHQSRQVKTVVFRPGMPNSRRRISGCL